MDFFPLTAWEPFIVEITFILNMVTSIPVFHNTAKRQFVMLVFKRKQHLVSPKKVFLVEIGYTFLSLAFAIASVLLGADISIVIGITGVFAGFIIVFLIPGLIHL